MIQNIIRATHRSWPKSIEEDSFYSGIVTIDPEEVVSAWSKLSQSTIVFEVVFLPLMLHKSLKKALRRKSDDK